MGPFKCACSVEPTAERDVIQAQSSSAVPPLAQSSKVLDAQPRWRPALSKQDVLQWLSQISDAEMADFIALMLKLYPSMWKQVDDLVAKRTGSDMKLPEVKLQIDPPDCQKFEQHEIIPAEVKKENASEAAKFAYNLPIYDMSSFKRPEMPTVQFGTPLYYGNESDCLVEIELVRIGNESVIQSTHAAVNWSTSDGTAKAGVKYVAASGRAEFAPGAAFTSIKVVLINNEAWEATTDFSIDLIEDGSENLEFHRYHMHCRIKVLSDDTFPTNRFEDKLKAGKIDPKQVPTIQLMVEYFKMNFTHSNIRKASIKWMITDVFEIMVALGCLVAKVMMINKLFMPVIKGELSWNASGVTLLICLASTFVVPQHIIHFLHYKRITQRLAGACRKILQASLIRRYMAYSPESLAEAEHGLIMLTMFKEIPFLVDNAYIALFFLLQDVGMLLSILFYQIVLVQVMGLATASPKWIAMNVGIVFLYPLIMGFSFHFRASHGHKLGLRRKDTELVSTNYTMDVLNTFPILADFGKRVVATVKFEETLNDFSAARNAHSVFVLHNTFVPISMSHMISSVWMVFGGILLVNGEMEMGTFLANLSIIQSVGDSWAGIYRKWVNIHECFTSLLVITRLLNLPTSEYDEMEYKQSCCQKARERSGLIAKASSEEQIVANQQAIIACNLSYDFPHKPCFRGVDLEMEQGKMHIIAGRRATGKSTLLRLIGGSIVKRVHSGGTLVVPAHLRMLHVSKEPLFFMGTLYENLIYGVKAGDGDATLERVLAICRSLQILEETIAEISEDPKAEAQEWNHVLSLSDCHLLLLARGLITNPEILCIHKPSAGLGPRTVPVVFNALKTYVAERGNEQNVERYFYRRPRTCVYTFSTDGDEAYADVIHRPFEHPSAAPGAGG